jgi:hypothetical protein
MDIWNKVCVTSPEHTKTANNGRYKFTCVDPQYQTKVATEVFGAYGSGWGIKDCKFTILEDAGFIMLEAVFFYKVGQKTKEFPYAVDMRFKAGDDCCKKLMTSMQSKCLSKLGFSADVYLGLYDDVQYVKDAGLKHSTKNRQAQWVTEVVSSIDNCKTIDELDKCKSRIEVMTKRSTVPEDYVDAINQAMHDKEKELE